MSKTIVFIQINGRHGIIEAEIAELTVGSLLDALAGAGVKVDGETFVFLDDAETPLGRERLEAVPHLKHGARIHVCRCHRVHTTVHYLDKTAEHAFAPGARVKGVKAWAVDKFRMDHKDAAEHVLQVCNSADRPPSDTPLHLLVHGHHCKVCFDLVPEKRVEG
jgi:hypothetical protein